MQYHIIKERERVANARHQIKTNEIHRLIDFKNVVVDDLNADLAYRCRSGTEDRDALPLQRTPK